jgi:hypothetical protein
MPGIVDMFTNQNVLWERKIPNSEDVNGNPQFMAPTTIQCRAVKQRKLHRTEIGDVIPTTWSVLAKDTIDIGDRLTVNGESFFISNIEYSDVIWIDGSWWGRWVYGGG